LPEIAPEELSLVKEIVGETRDPLTYIKILLEKLGNWIHHNARFLARLFVASTAVISRRVLSLFFWRFGKLFGVYGVILDALKESLEVLKEYINDEKPHGPIIQAIQSLGVRGLGIIGGLLGAAAGETAVAALLGLLTLIGTPLILTGTPLIVVLVTFGFIGGALGSWLGHVAGSIVYDLSSHWPSESIADTVQPATRGNPPSVPNWEHKPPRPPYHEETKKPKPYIFLPPPGPLGPLGSRRRSSIRPQQVLVNEVGGVEV
jgi:hypothetical protein